jgi:tetratricopeptide (TPR) repeat protein
MSTTPNSTDIAIAKIHDLLQRRQGPAALALAEDLTRTHPALVAGWVLLSRARQQTGDFEGAREAARRATTLDPTLPGPRLILAEALLQAGDAEEGFANLARLERDIQHNPVMLRHLAEFYIRINRHEDAGRCQERVCELVQPNATDLGNLATAKIGLGRMDEAETLLTRAIAAEPADYDSYYNRATLRTQTAGRNHLAEMERVLAGPARNPAAAFPLHLALAKELEDLGRHAESFAHLARGASARRAQLAYRVEDDVAALAEIARVFTGDVFAGAKPGHDSARPIFVLGLPRSGTTLIDRILSSHTDVASLGEPLDFAMALVRCAGPADKITTIRRSVTLDFAALGRAYCENIAVFARSAPRLVDKTPLNFLYLGLIALALPNAAIIHVRRQPMDVCYAMYKTLFRMPYPFSYDLGDLGRYYVAYDRLMTHWRAVLPGRFLEVDYEDLVRNQEPVTRRMLAHCRLDWQDACLTFDRNPEPSLTASAAQVRQPIHSRSVGLWRHYAAELEPLAAILRAAGVDAGA